MTFDPNYNYDDEEEEEDSMDVEEGLEEESDDEYSDDDDMSWKVRRSSIKCLESLIATQRDLLLSFFSSVCPALLAVAPPEIFHRGGQMGPLKILGWPTKTNNLIVVKV
ncbi:cullin-associated NEDD8-dissociated protein 1-like isoform X1 [Trematomus bernacchii]|uniref:cullin-associated NEDD8-dissociated protein 1-like isoform X1 n=1 Tax=Trematomus bernacchii TaxID=40690 RepID=UPI00146F227C|nr:cullin-associated NEDD8-dissociated protein 1-like isoform X1 [Trematomus bernacchii]